MCVEQFPFSPVSPDVVVDGLVADKEDPQLAQVSGWLLGTPLPAQQFIDQCKVLCREAQIAAVARVPPVGTLLGCEGAVATV